MNHSPRFSAIALISTDSMSAWFNIYQSVAMWCHRSNMVEYPVDEVEQ